MHRLLRTMFVVLGLTLLGPSIGEAAFPGHNGKLAYTSCSQLPSGAFECDVFVMNPDGSDKQNLTSNPGVDYNPHWSADGRRIVFNSERGNGLQIYVMDADGTDPMSVTSETHAPLTPSWSPDGKQIVFASDRHDPLFRYSEIYVINADGTGLRRLTQPFLPPNQDTPVHTAEPAWAPDGQRIAFSSARWPFPTGRDVYTIRPDGSGETGFTASGDQVSPDWSPDGSKLLFLSSSSIGVMNADGSGQTALTPPGRPVEHPAWSPDGQRIVSDDSSDIYVRNADGTAPVNITNDGLTVRESGPSWQPVIGPARTDYKNAAQFCRAEREFLGDSEFAQKYGTNTNESNAFGKCVGRNA